MREPVERLANPTYMNSMDSWEILLYIIALSTIVEGEPFVFSMRCPANSRFRYEQSAYISNCSGLSSDVFIILVVQTYATCFMAFILFLEHHRIRYEFAVAGSIYSSRRRSP